MGVTMWVQMKLNPAPPDPIQAKIFAWMPIFFTFLLASFPAGLVIYWAWNNLLSVIQQSVDHVAPGRRHSALEESSGLKVEEETTPDEVTEKKASESARRATRRGQRQADAGSRRRRGSRAGRDAERGGARLDRVRGPMPAERAG